MRILLSNVASQFANLMSVVGRDKSAFLRSPTLYELHLILRNLNASEKVVVKEEIDRRK